MRHCFLLLGLLGAATGAAQAQDLLAKPFDLTTASIASIQAAFDQRQITCQYLVGEFLTRIKAYNLSVTQGAPLNAIARLNTDALEQARALDAEAPDTRITQALFCTPVLLKDNIDAYDVTSSSGSFSLLGNQPIHDAFLTAKLRQAGAIILGKGTMDEFASGLFGISSGGGRTGNAYATNQNPGGSSGGPAVAVSANFAVLGVGTDNSGSVRIPAAWNGIVGLRPSTGLISQRGIFPRGNMDGIAGPLARNVPDLARMLDVIAQADPQDPKTLNIPRPKSYRAYLQADALKGRRIGIVRTLGSIHPYDGMPQATQATIQAAFASMQAHGTTLVPNIDLSEHDLDRRFNQAGEREQVNRYLASYPAVRKNYADICLSGRASIMGSPQECLQRMHALPPENGPEEQSAQAMFAKNRRYVQHLMDNQQLDALLIPVNSTGSATYHAQGFANELLASNAGLPGITLNVGYTQAGGMPIGVELIARQYDEGRLIALAYAYEQSIGAYHPPSLPTADNTLQSLDIPAYNNLLAQIADTTFQSIFSQSTPDQVLQRLTPEVFRAIVQSQQASFMSHFQEKRSDGETLKY